MSALGTAVGLGVALPFALAAPAHAQAILSISKSHEGNFARGGQGAYSITLSNSGDDTSGQLLLTDNLPAGLTVAGLDGYISPGCDVTNAGATLRCDGFALSNTGSATLIVTVNVAVNAPCSVTNTVTLTETGTGQSTVSDGDPTTITGGECDGGNSGGGGSILPINLNGIIPMFNNITTNSNINSPGASNNSRQNFGLNAP
ncbi:hypothetical protein ACWCQK_17990 [Streptomyces sp. NPDC002306]